jgi:hypothetical protein
MTRHGIAAVVGIVGLFLLAPLAALPMDGQAWELKPKIDLSKAHASFLGEDAVDYSGWSVATGGDANGDGYDDILIGAAYDSDAASNAGQTYLIFGRATGLVQDTDLSRADASFRGEAVGDWSGYSVDFAGDVNGDGFDDIIIGAVYNDEAHGNAGQVYLIFGKASGWAMDTSLGSSSASFFGEEADDQAGKRVAGAGDVNGDGYDDFVIGAPYNDEVASSAGQVYLILGKSSGWSMNTDLSGASGSFRGEVGGDWAGFSVAGAGDVNRDGYDDLLVGAPYNGEAHAGAGQAYLILGKASGWAMDNSLGSSSASFWGESAYDLAAWCVAGVGDVNGDGYDDLLVGAWQNSEAHVWNSGQTYLILGKASGWSMNTDLSAASASFWGEYANDYAGSAVAGAGDVNRDGYDDFIIAAWNNGQAHAGAGQVYLLLGKASGWALDRDLSTAECSFLGENGNDFIGYYDYGLQLGGGGDVNGDGYDDFLMSSMWNSEAHGNAGQTWLIMPFSAPPPAKNLQATLAPSLKYINLTWDATGTWNEPITGYRVYRSTDGSHYTDVAFRGASDRSYSDSNLTYGRTYHYIVITVDGNGDESYATSSVSLICDRDTDSDGIGDLADWDDDGDGYVDGSDAFPLNSAEWLDTDLDGTGNNADTDDDNDGIPDASDARPLDPVNGLWDDIRFVNTTLRSVQTAVSSVQAALAVMSTDIATLSTSLAGVNASLTRTLGDLNATLRRDLSGLNATMLAEMASTRNALSADIDNVWDLLSAVSDDLDGMNASLRKNLSEVEGRLRADIASLAAALDAVNASLQEELAGMSDDIAAFRQMMAQNLTTIYGRMDRQDANQSRDMARIEALLDGMNDTSLAGMKDLLSELQTRTDLLDANLSSKVTDFRDKTMLRFDNVSRLMATMDSINALNTEVKLVQGQAKDIQREQDATSKKVGDLGMPAWGAMIIIIIVLVVAILLLLGSRKGGNEPAQVVEMGPPPQSPPPAPPLRQEPMPPMPPMRPVPPPEGGKFHP